MAIVCCEIHGAPRGKIHKYLFSVRPVGYPNPAVLCYKKGCKRPGVVWLNEIDKKNYDKGEKDIIIWGQVGKIKVT